MKKLLIFSSILLFFPNTAFAETNVSVSSEGNSSINVKSESQGSSTTCINGDCTTEEGENHSTVCINGDCQESDGDISLSENNGRTQVQIKTNSGNNSLSATSNSNVESNNGKDATNSVEKDDEERKDNKESKSFLDQIGSFFKNLFSFL